MEWEVLNLKIAIFTMGTSVMGFALVMAASTVVTASAISSRMRKFPNSNFKSICRFSSSQE